MEITESLIDRSLHARVEAMPLGEQHHLAKILAADVYAWVIGDPMASGENHSFVDSEFMSTYYDLERYAKQDEVIVLAAPGARLPIVGVTVL